MRATDGIAVPKLTAAVRYLVEKLSASEPEVHLSRECLEDLALDAIDAAGRTRRKDEPYIACVRRHLDARVRFITLWISTDEAFDRAAWHDLVRIARTHGVPRSKGIQNRFPADR